MREEKQQQAFDQVKQEVAHAMTLVLIKKESDVKVLLYSSTGKNSSLWQQEQELVAMSSARDERQAVGILESELQKSQK